MVNAKAKTPKRYDENVYIQKNVSKIA